MLSTAGAAVGVPLNAQLKKSYFVEDNTNGNA